MDRVCIVTCVDMCGILGCYGCGETSTSTKWQCDRCESGPSHLQDCCLCQLRGGALKRTDGGRWAHLVCAQLIPEVTVNKCSVHQSIITDHITRSRRKLVSPLQILSDQN